MTLYPDTLIQMLVDAHTHNSQSSGAIINLDLNSPAMEVGKVYSVGLHPWKANRFSAEMAGRIAQLAENPSVVAIGETGIDRAVGIDLEKQEDVFRFHIALSERLAKPLVIHEVKSPDIVLKMRRGASQPWVRHGFRGNASVARMYYDHGIYLSIGEHFAPEAVRAIQLNRLLLESYESLPPIAEIAARVASVRGISASELLAATTATLASLVNHLKMR